jgi:hypothetical protein
MGKLLFWIVIVFGLLLVARLVNAAAAKRRNAAASGAAGNAPGASPMVRCVRCGVFLPRSEATAVQGGHACADPACADHR